MKPYILLATLAVAPLFAQQPSYQFHRYDTTDGGILYNLSDNGQWGIVRLGTTSGGGNATPKLFDVSTDEAFEVSYKGRTIDIYDVSDDGNIVVGSLSNQPVAYNRATDELTKFPLRKLWAWGGLTSITPDGKWAVGFYNNYQGVFDSAEGLDGEQVQLSGDFYYSPLMVNIETGDTLALPGLPKLDMAHLDQHAMVFDAITPDGNFAIGRMDWYILQPASGFTFIYNTREHTYEVLGYTENDHAPWTPQYSGLHHIESGVLSPDGHYLAGSAYMVKEGNADGMNNEYGCPYRLDLTTGEIQFLDDTESNNISVGAVANDGTLFGNPETGGPLRNFRVLYKDKYWISFSQICQQAYGFNFAARTGYEYTGTVLACNSDGSRFISFPDPTSQSYLFDFGRPIADVCAGIDLLSNYTVSPEAGSEFALISNIEINFGRAVQVLGNGSNVRLYKKDGTLVYTGLSNGGLTLKTGSRNTVVAAFRTRPLEAGVDYELVIDAGAIAVSGDAEITNSEIRIAYSGRSNGPVQLVKATPADGSSLRQIDNSTSYILLDFDSSIKTTESPFAYIERVDDGSRLTTMSIAAGSTEDTRRQLLLTPATTVYLYAGEDYRLVIEEGSVCDRSGAENSINQRIELIYHGMYVREVASETVMFSDDFNNPNESLNLWMRFEGDHHKPTETMKAWGFDADNNPWNYTLHDTEGSADYFAGSHSMYSPAATSDDWMLTPQISVPLDGKATLSFDAQSYNPNKQDYLSIYVFEERRVLSYLNTPIMNGLKGKAVLLDSILLTPGLDPDLTADEWTRYEYSLSRWAGKDIYIAFANQNRNQSAIFVDNVCVQREINFSLAFSNRDRVIAQEQINIAGQLTVLCDETEGNCSLTLRDGQGSAVSRIEWPSIPAKGSAVDFAFDQPLPLTIGNEVPYSITVQIGEKTDEYKGSILNLAFEPVKRVLLEEMTGNTCINCPLGIVAIEQCQRAFGDRFIPVGIHSYTGDNLGSYFSDYSNFLGLQAAPTARINRLEGTYSPMAMIMGEEFLYHDVEGTELWYDVVARELDRLTSADLSLNTQLSEDGKYITFDTDLRYAVDATDQQLSLLLLVLEDGIESFQLNGFSSMESSTLAEWCNGGPYAEYAAYPYKHNHVARAVIGQTFSGTIGQYPSTIKGGETYTSHLTSPCPESILDTTQLTGVAVLIDTQTGEVINAVASHITSASDNAIHHISEDDVCADDATIRTLSGMVVRSNRDELPAGIYLIGRRKVIVK